MKPAPVRCRRCQWFVAGFRGRLIHVDGQGGIVRILDHQPDPATKGGAS